MSNFAEDIERNDSLVRVTITAPGFSAEWAMPRERVADMLKFAAECIIESNDAMLAERAKKGGAS